MGDMVVVRDPLGHPAAVLRRRTARCSPPPARASPLLNLGFRDIQSLEPGRDDPHPGRRAPPSSGSPSASGRPTASSSGSTSPTSPARSTTAASTCRGARWARNWPSRSGSWAACRSTTDTIVVPVPDTGKAAADAMAYELGIPSRRRADPQPLHRPHVHRGRQPRRQGAAEVHAAARSAGRQAGAAGRGLDRPLHDDEERCCTTCASRAGRRRSTSASPARRSSRRASTAST